MIHFTNISKKYDGRYALKNINFHLEKGEMAFLTGHSGAGKSTLLRLLTRHERPTEGQIFVNGRNLGRMPARHIPLLRRSMGVIFQDPMLLKDRNVFNNVALPLQISGLQSKEIAKRTRAALNKVGLLKYENKYPEQLSTGEQQRVSIARAVVHRPPLLIADEPTGNLDSSLSLEIMRIFEQFNRVGVTVFIASHDLPLIANLQQRVITLDQGQLIHARPPN